MTERPMNVLFLCTGNSARSILAEGLLNHWGQGRFKAYSAGSHPTGQVQPLAIDILKRMRIPVGEPRSKDWVEFEGEDAPQLESAGVDAIWVSNHAGRQFDGAPASIDVLRSKWLLRETPIWEMRALPWSSMSIVDLSAANSCLPT